MTYGYAIARTKKLKRHNLAGSEAHTARTRETPNADPEKQNIRLIGSTEQNEHLEDLVLAKIGQYEQKRKIRTDAVYCVEILLTASPQYYRPDDPTRAGYYHEDKLKQWVDANLKWLQDAYQDRIVRCELHLDEATPHLHAYLVPLDKDGQLRCNHFFDGRQKMMAFQDDYHTAMQHLGLERGIKGSKAQHQDIKDFYRIVEEGKDLEPGKLTSEQLQAKSADRDRAIRKKKEMEATAKQLVKENEALEARIQQLSAENQQLRSERTQLADQLRDLPLEDVAWHLGLTQDTKGNLRWKGVGHIINIDGSKWYDFSPSVNKGGGGAIDLVMHVNGCNFKEAISWLNDRFGESEMERAVTHHAREQAAEIARTEPTPQFVPPVEDESNWQAVYNYLTQKRGLPENLVQHLHTSGLVYADSQQNAVFLMRGLNGETTGAFLRGTRGEDNTFIGYATGTKRTEGWFYIRWGGQPSDEIQRVVLCKSPVDALSFAMLEVEALGEMPQQRTICMAADSVRSVSVEFLKNIPTVVAAYDNDAAGDETAQAIMELLPLSCRVRPQAKDWNQELLEQLQKSEQKHNKQLERD
ncbi:plasmid recombinant protein (plasmid) [Tolypothrix tenuis PCC 7101]|uniref:Plasmid recombinant protein n=1 Tax=Tolypothrix tenuis PCC 7101 TaxID=231146 RepID=A0A1Z4NCC8_9CYAN|nr:plasmid recombination protein [Aulosira sp. FACHB-113]BAZ03355.1 plasmid recombinant protein [Tolypothrix tenuis PCC 7101]BAZ78752.1 plasmid recombinant protein [Aulosira laxa NIES-50]